MKEEKEVSKEEKEGSMTIEEATGRMRQFVAEREWQQFHTPRNLVLAMVGEVGEVAELFQWKGEVTHGLPEMTEEERTHVGEELADVFSYLIRLSDECGIDLSQAFQRKMKRNEMKYPKDLVKGSSKKYTHYKHNKPES